MKEKITTALRTKFAQMGFGEKAFDGVADYLSKTVTEESQIETAIGGVEGLLKAFQGDIDKVRGENSALKKQMDDLKKTNTEGKAQTPPANGDADPNGDSKQQATLIAEAVAAAMKPFVDRIASFEQANKAAERQTAVAAKATEYGIPDSFVSRFSIPEDADLDTYMKDVQQEFANIGFKGTPKPQTGDRVADEGQSLARMIDADTKQIVEQQKQ